MDGIQSIFSVNWKSAPLLKPVNRGMETRKPSAKTKFVHSLIAFV